VGTWSPSGRRGSRSRPWADAVLLVPLLVLAVAARRPGYLLSHAFWLDEGWVADSVRAPLHQLRLLSSSTPIGWTLLLRLVPDVGPPERLRLLPLAFGVASVVAAYLLGRQLGRVQAVAAGLAAALAPSMLRNHSLKQYSADAFVTLLLLWLGGRLASRWSRWRLAAFCLACLPAVLISHVTVFVSAAVLGALWLHALAGRRWGRLGWLTAAGLVVAGVEGAAYLAFADAGNSPVMQRWWAADFVPVGAGLGPAASFLGGRSADALERVGFGPWPLAAALVVGGLVALWRARLGVVAGAVAILAAELVVAGALRRYPFLDQRTSVFFASLLTVCAALGVGAAVAWSARRPPTVPVGAVAVLGACLLLVPAARDSAMHPMPPSTVRQQVQHVLLHRQPGDVVVVGAGASFAFGYYWPQRPTFNPATARTAVLFQVDYPGRDDLVLVHEKDDQSIGEGMRLAAARSVSGRVWVVLADAGDRSPGWRPAIAEVGRVVRPVLPKLVLVRYPPSTTCQTDRRSGTPCAADGRVS
jgi:hypothetical protein